jgi:hypothetical protein
MSRTVWNYPKSSCACYQCTSESYPCSEGNPTNLGVRGCNVSDPYYNCFYRRKFRQDTEPVIKTGKTILNPQALTSKYPVDFKQMTCQKKSGSCLQEQYISHDPRLVSAAHMGQTLTFSDLPLDTTVKLNTLLVDPTLDNYGQNYGTYSDIKAGNVAYYIDHSIEDPMFYPNFTIPAQIDGNLYKDPMGAFKPEYNRYPVKCRNVLDPNVNSYYGSLSSLEDSLGQREDIMALQMRKRNQQRWEPRWEGNNNHCFPH